MNFFDMQSPAKKGRALIDNPVLFSNSEEPSVVFLIDELLSEAKIRTFKAVVSSFSPGITYSLIYCLKIQITEKDLEREIIDLFSEERIKFSNYIKPWSKIITIGRSLYSITQSDDLEIEGFCDTILNDTSFFTPELLCQVFPTFYLESWIRSDSFERNWTKIQVNNSLNFELNRRRIRSVEKVEPEDPNAFLRQYVGYPGITAFDLETKGLDPWNPEGFIICLTLAFEENLNKGYYLDFRKIDLVLLNEFFRGKLLVGNNIKYDIKWLVLKGAVDRDNLVIFWDNMKGSHAINELQKNSLKSDAWLLTDLGGYDLPLEQYKKQYPKCKSDYSLIPKDVMKPYAVTDAVASLQSYFKQRDKIRELDAVLPKLEYDQSLERLLLEVTWPAYNAFVDIELEGMCINWDLVDYYSKLCQEELKEKRKKVYEVLEMPSSVNFDSGTQLGRFLEAKGWENPGRSKEGYFLTNENSMIYWKKKGHKEIPVLLDYIGLYSLYKTFIGSPVNINEKGKDTGPSGIYQYRKLDGRVHSTFWTMMADSWRGRSSEPNLQNIVKTSDSIWIPFFGDSVEGKKYTFTPDAKVSIKRDGIPLEVLCKELIEGKDLIKTSWAERVRSFYSTPDASNYKISEDDAAGLQLRIGAVFSGDETMRKIFLELGGDMHSMTSLGVFARHMTLDEFLDKKKKGDPQVKEWRKKAKAVNFGLLFGSTSFGFAQNSLLNEWSFDEAKEFVRNNRLENRQKNFRQILSKDNAEELGISEEEFETLVEDNEKFSYYWASAEFIRKNFFETYPGLEEWHKKNHLLAETQGFIQAPMGMIRRLPRLLLRGTDDKNSVISNQKNISLNSPTQGFESWYMMRGIAILSELLKENKCLTRLIGNVHDSFIKYLHSLELGICKDLIDKSFHEPHPIMKGIPFEIEKSYCDYAKGQYWGVTETEWK